ncbi:sensor histidine kinase [Jeotgalibacillus sp. JSM ZJ347]|uniref:cache domain-containing sensor histidine kinase n=1 Tax=Jeotgalibacillus sp. JSM ZJ347 TaxID=3342117 RepID=UPI0035A97CA8
MSFRSKMLLAFLGFVLVPIAVLGGVSYYFSSSALQSNISDQTVQTLRAVDRNLMKAVSEVNTFSDFIISSSEVQSFIETNASASLVDLYEDEQSIAGLMYGNAQVDDFVVYSSDGDVLNLREATVPSYAAFSRSAFREEMAASQGRPVWMTPAMNRGWSTGVEPLLTQGRVIKDVNTLEDLGYFVINIKIRLFDELFEQFVRNPSEEYIINQRGDILYALDHKRIGERLDLDELGSLEQNTTGYFLSEWNDERSLLTYIPSAFTTLNNDSLMMVSIQPWSALAGEVIWIRNATIGLLVGAILLALLFNWLYLGRVSRFIHESLSSMKQVEQGSLDVEMKTFRLPELRNISNGFNSMIARIRSLIDDVKVEQEYKREAQFRVLQEQINPHFLYNTLESINALAAMNGQREISRMTINLGKLLRISINGGFEVTVKDEIRHVISYLEIQKIRYDHAFTFDVEVEEALQSAPVLKLILQPLVENSIKYAFTQGKEGSISIRGWQDGEQGYLLVTDNGRGLTEDVLKTWVEAEHEDGGHGLKNVHKRLELYYGKPYGMMVCSGDGAGTAIRITFPIRGGEHHDSRDDRG